MLHLNCNRRLSNMKLTSASKVIYLYLYCHRFTLYPEHSTLLSAEFRFSRHCVLSHGTQHRALPRYQSEEMKFEFRIVLLLRHNSPQFIFILYLYYFEIFTLRPWMSLYLREFVFFSV